MTTKNQPKIRPGWHNNLKWVCGILLFLALGATLLLYNLTNLTQRNPATTISATIVAGLFSKDGLDSEKDIAELRQKSAGQPGEIITPIEQFPWMQISKHDLATLAPRELRIKLFRQLTEPIYDDGLAGAASKLTADPAKQQDFIKDATILGVFTKTTHQQLYQALLITSAISALLLIGVICFSTGWGRVISPAIALLLASPLGALAWLMLKFPPPDGNSPLAKLPSEISSQLSTTLGQSYVIAFWTGTGLLLLTLFGKIIQKLIHAKQSQ